MALLWLPYLWQPYLQWLYLWESGQVFQLIEPIRPTKAIKQMHNQPIYIDASRKWAWLHQLPTRQTRIAMVFIFSLVYKIIFSLVYEATFFAVRTELTMAVTSLLVNVKPTRSCETSKNVTVHLTAW